MKSIFGRRKTEIKEGVIEELNRYIKEKRIPREDTVYCDMDSQYFGNVCPDLDAAKRKGQYSVSHKRASYSSEPRLGQASLRIDTELEDKVRRKKKTFQESLFEIIDKKGLTDAEVYRSADIDRRLFSKIRNNTHYHPTKKTALALAIALKLNLDETTDLIRRAGYALSMSNTADIIIRFCIEKDIFDIMEVNTLLYHYDQPLLGGQI